MLFDLSELLLPFLALAAIGSILDGSVFHMCIYSFLEGFRVAPVTNVFRSLQDILQDICASIFYHLFGALVLIFSFGVGWEL